MKKVYSVIIKGRTLESRDLKELLARAVAQKRISDRKLLLQNLSRGQALAENAPTPISPRIRPPVSRPLCFDNGIGISKPQMESRALSKG